MYTVVIQYFDVELLCLKYSEVQLKGTVSKWAELQCLAEESVRLNAFLIHKIFHVFYCKMPLRNIYHSAESDFTPLSRTAILINIGHFCGRTVISILSNGQIWGDITATVYRLLITVILLKGHRPSTLAQNRQLSRDRPLWLIRTVHFGLDSQRTSFHVFTRMYW